MGFKLPTVDYAAAVLYSLLEGVAFAAEHTVGVFRPYTVRDTRENLPIMEMEADHLLIPRTQNDGLRAVFGPLGFIVGIAHNCHAP